MTDSDGEKSRKLVFAQETLKLLKESGFEIIDYIPIKSESLSYLDAGAKLNGKDIRIGILCQGICYPGKKPTVEMDLLVHGSPNGNKHEKYIIGGERDDLFDPLNEILRLFLEKYQEENSLLKIEDFFRNI